MAEILSWCCALFYLLLCARSDLRTRSIRTRPAVILACCALAFRLLYALLRAPAGSSADSLLAALLEYGAGAVPGLILLFLSFAAKHAVGSGDGLACMAAGCLTGLTAEAGCLFLGLLFSAACSAVLLIRKKASRGDCIPFLPFLFCGHAVGFILTLCSAA